MNVDVENVEDKIRRALENPSLEDSVIIKAPEPKKEVKKSFTYAKIAKILFFAFVLSILYLARYDRLFNIQLTGVVLRAEKVLSMELPIFRKVFAINYKLNAEQFVGAIKSGDIVLGNLLIEWGLDPNSTDAAGDTLLIVAVKKEKSELVNVLLNKGANANLQNSRGEYALDFASPSLIELLVKAGADINVRDLSQKTYLIKSAMKNDLELIKVLIKAGADPNLQDSQGKTALHYAVENKQEQIVSFLKLVGSDQNIADKSGSKAIEEPKKEEIVKTQPPVAPTQFVKMTAVRVIGKVTGVWENNTDITLKEVSAEVRNVGDVEANNVVIRVKIPGGREITLDGPQTLPKYTTIVYKAAPNEVITRAGDLKAIVSCSNCHK